MTIQEAVDVTIVEKMTAMPLGRSGSGAMIHSEHFPDAPPLDTSFTYPSPLSLEQPTAPYFAVLAPLSNNTSPTLGMSVGSAWPCSEEGVNADDFWRQQLAGRAVVLNAPNATIYITYAANLPPALLKYPSGMAEDEGQERSSTATDSAVKERTIADASSTESSSLSVPSSRDSRTVVHSPSVDPMLDWRADERMHTVGGVDGDATAAAAPTRSITPELHEDIIDMREEQQMSWTDIADNLGGDLGPEALEALYPKIRRRSRARKPKSQLHGRRRRNAFSDAETRALAALCDDRRLTWAACCKELERQGFPRRATSTLMQHYQNHARRGQAGSAVQTVPSSAGAGDESHSVGE